MKEKKRRKEVSASLERRRREDEEQEEKKSSGGEERKRQSIRVQREGLVPSTAHKLQPGAKARSRVLGPSGACVESDMR